MTKRVSNIPPGAGRHAPRQHTDSPATKEQLGKSGRLICKSCAAQYHEKHWYTTDVSLKESEPIEPTETLCPGCERVAKKIWRGDVLLEGPAVMEMRESIMTLIRRVETKCWHDNPASRIASIEEVPGKMAIKTTTEWLATRIGKVLKKACKGTLAIKACPEKDMVDVHWTSRENAAGKR